MEFSVNGPMDVTQTETFIQWCRSSYVSHGIGPWALEQKMDGAFVGFAGLSKEIIDGVEEVHVGYRLARAWWHQGFATEAVDAVVDYGLTGGRCRDIYAIIEPAHKASIRVIEKTGFTFLKQTPFHDRCVNIYGKTTSWPR